MLIKFGAKNFYCFKDGVELSLELGANCPGSISKNKKISHLLCVKGANGSGKTSVLKIISFLGNLCVHSFSKKPEEKLFVDPYFFNENEIEIFCEFELENIQYKYEASLTNEKILSEELFRKKRRFTSLFQRKNNEIKKCIDEFSELKQIKLRDNSSIISTAHQYTLETIKPIYSFFNSIITNVSWSGRRELSDYAKTSELYSNDKNLLEFSKNIIIKCDPGIQNISIHHRNNESGEKIYFPLFEHSVKSKQKKLIYYSESSGTRALYNILPAYYTALTIGGILVLDEFDINFHPDILPILVEMFDNKKINKNNAQMIFTTHNTDIMDYMGKYRTFLVNQEDSECYGYRLDEIPGDTLRNDRPISTVYKSGKIGGVPKL